MSKIPVENCDNSEYATVGVTGLSSAPVNLVEENLRLHQAVSALGNKLNATALEFRRKHSELLTAIEALSNQVNSNHIVQ